MIGPPARIAMVALRPAVPLIETKTSVPATMTARFAVINWHLRCGLWTTRW
jgi:hypothetical protein